MLLTVALSALQTGLGSTSLPNSETLRKIERGARIVAVVPQHTKLIFQVNAFSLCIYPQMIV